MQCLNMKKKPGKLMFINNLRLLFFQRHKKLKMYGTECKLQRPKCLSVLPLSNSFNSVSLAPKIFKDSKFLTVFEFM